MFEKVLIANRGEIAVRVIRACRELGIKSVAVYSEADKESLHTKLADEAYCIGPHQLNQSYLNIPHIMSAAEVSGADAIHPGYGFLAENSQFAEICESCEITFIGPPPDVIKKLGDKSLAKKIVIEAGLPVLPGTDSVLGSEAELIHMAKEINYPLIIKASSGGGGRGMRIVHDKADLIKCINTAASEAGAAFGNSSLYMEKYVERARHVEFQILADKRGNIIHLGERDCSVQRRHQKLIEESPCPVLSDKKREEIGETAIKIAKAVGYENAGTVEFLLDEKGNYYFLEVNTRVQVEHPVTEMVTGRDIIKEQILLASGEDLDIKQSDVVLNGHAFEFRINAEDVKKNFLPKGGTIDLYNPPGGPGVRVDTHIYSGYEVPVFYDSLLAKLIVWGSNREEAIARSIRALDEFIIIGVETTIPFYLHVLNNDIFRKGQVFTEFVSAEFISDFIGGGNGEQPGI